MTTPTASSAPATAHSPKPPRPRSPLVDGTPTPSSEQDGRAYREAYLDMLYEGTGGLAAAWGAGAQYWGDLLPAYRAGWCAAAAAFRAARGL